MDHHRVTKTCPDCGFSLTDAHPNRKRCEPCAEARRRAPAGRLAPWQEDMVRVMINIYTQEEMAQRIGVSKTTVSRWLREQGLHSHAQKYGDDVVEAVLAVYETHGKAEAQKQFPNVTIRSIVERHRHAPRQVRWQDPELIEAARMAGLVRHGAQALYFDRPNAYSGSIKSLWLKQFRCAPYDVNGLSVHLAWRIARPGVVATTVYHANAASARTKILWLDLAAALRDDLESWVVRAVEALARFQAWLHGTWSTDDIRQMITEREALWDERPRATRD